MARHDPYEGLDDMSHIPTVIASSTDETSAEVVISDGWGIVWELQYARCCCGDNWIPDGARAVPRSAKDPAARMNLDPPDSLIDLGLATLETI